MLKIAFFPMSFLHFFAVFYKKYSDLLQVVFQCKKYSKSTAGNGTQRKTVIFTADIFAVYILWKKHKIVIKCQYILLVDSTFYYILLSDSSDCRNNTFKH